MVLQPLRQEHTYDTGLPRQLTWFGTQPNLPVINPFELPVCILISNRNYFNYSLPILKHFIFLKLGVN